MEIPVVIEAVGPGYRARCRHPVAAEADGDTRFAALTDLEALLAARGVGPFTTLPIEADQPWMATAGWIPDDDVTADWLAAVAEYRRDRVDEDTSV